MKKTTIYSVILLTCILTISLFTSCDQSLPDNIAKAGALALTASKKSVILNQNVASTEAIGFTWTTGTNHGSGASISYLIQIDKKGNNFSKAISQDMGKGIYVQSIAVGDLNDSLLLRWGCTPGTATDLEARVISTVYSTPSVNDTSAVIIISVTPYQPVSTTLYLFGSASPNGTDLNNAILLTPQTDPTVFVYQGILNAGTLKFITTLGQELPSYNLGADTTQIVQRTAISQADNRFTVQSTGVYKVIVNLLDLSVSITKINFPAYANVYLAGTAAPNGTDYSKATKLTQSTTNPFIFTYQGALKAGSFKFPVNTNADGNQDMFMRTDDTHFYVHLGGSAGDDQWTIAKKGFYTITLNQQDNTISIYREKLYMVGSATPIGWTITNAIAMTENATDGCIFTYTGPMVAGEFKFPVNQNSSWAQDMYMRVDDTHMYRHIGGQADDNKWTITSAGNYVITADIETLTMSFVKQ